MKAINAYDLHHKFWRVRNSNLFKGDEGDVILVLGDMAYALEHTRERDIVHHDIKPANILYEKNVGAVLIDFGLATQGDEPPHQGGTPWYVGPELLNVKNERGPAADVWALGIVMLYMLRFIPLPETGAQVPVWLIHRARDPSSRAHAQMKRWHAIIDAILEEELDENNDLHKIVKRMLKPVVEQRITPGEIREALEAMKQRKREALEAAEQQKQEASKAAEQQEREASEAAEQQEREARKPAKRQKRKARKPAKK